MSNEYQRVTRSPHENAKNFNIFKLIILIFGVPAILWNGANSGWFFFQELTKNGADVNGQAIAVTAAITLFFVGALFTCTWVGLNLVPDLIRRGKNAVVGFFAIVFLTMVGTSYFTGVQAVTRETAEEAQLQKTLSNGLEIVAAKGEAVNNLIAKLAIISSRKVQFQAHYEGEVCCGNLSGTGGGTGVTASTVQSIVTALTVAEKDLVALDSKVKGLNRRFTVVKDQIVALQNSDMNYAEKTVTTENLMTTLGILSDELSATISSEVISNAADAVGIHARARGLSERAIAILDPETTDTATKLREGLAMIDQQKAREIKNGHQKTGLNLIFSSFEAVGLLVCVLAILELFNLVIIVIHTAIVTDTDAEKEANTSPPASPAPQQAMQASMPAPHAPHAPVQIAQPASGQVIGLSPYQPPKR